MEFKASKQVGIIYRTFYQHASWLTLLELYLAYVQPLLEYVSQLWDSLERVQKFRLLMSCKQWGSEENLLVCASRCYALIYSSAKTQEYGL